MLRAEVSPSAAAAASPGGAGFVTGQRTTVQLAPVGQDVRFKDRVSMQGG